MKIRILIYLFLLIFLLIDDVNARSSGSSRSSSRRSGSSRSSSRRSGSSRSSSLHSSYSSSSRSKSSSSYSSGHRSSSGSHTTESNPTGTSSSHHQRNKDASFTFLHAEGGGATRPSQTNSAQSGRPSSPHDNAGFERVFTSERYGTEPLEVQDWIYFNYQELKNRIDDMGYVDTMKLGDMDGIIRPNATIFMGTLPEFEMSPYTICFYTRPNNLCPVSLDGNKFNIFTHSFRHYGRDLIDSALPIF